MMAALTASLVIAGALLLMALLVVWSRVRTWLRAAAIPLALTSALVTAVLMGSTLGYAIPLINGVTVPPGDYLMSDVKLLREDGIYGTITLPSGPRLYRMPWNEQMAEKLQEMMSKGGGAPNLKLTVPPFEFSWGQPDPDFQPLPQPKILPDKPPEAPQAPRFAA